MTERGATPRPRVGFLGVGWIGRQRLDAIAASGAVDVVAVADADRATAAAVARPHAAAVVDPDHLATQPDLDAVVIATPSALHAGQAVDALRAGRAVFCQKPLGRNAAETRSVVDAAAAADRLLGVDLSYRHIAAARRMRDVIAAGEIGDVYAAELTFHNAYGPDKPWFRDRARAGGGCVIDLGTHLVDLAQWMLPGQRLRPVAARLYAGGRRLDPGAEIDVTVETVESVAAVENVAAVEDYAAVMLETSAGATVALSCSWFLSAGRDAVIGATFHGSSGSVALQNVGGSFYDFASCLRRGTTEELLVAGVDDWGGRAAVAWAEQLARDGRHRPDTAAEYVAVAEVIDGIYGR